MIEIQLWVFWLLAISHVVFCLSIMAILIWDKEDWEKDYYKYFFLIFYPPLLLLVFIIHDFIKFKIIPKLSKKA